MNETESSSLYALNLLLTSAGTTIMELLLLGVAVFVPTKYYRITNPWVILIQFASLTGFISFFQGQRFAASPGLLERIGEWWRTNLYLLGLFAVIPLNLILSFVYSKLEGFFASVMPEKYLFPILIGVLLLNFTAGVYGSRYEQMRIESSKKPTKFTLFSFMVWLMLLGWGTVLSILVFIFRLNISPRFPQ